MGRLISRKSMVWLMMFAVLFTLLPAPQASAEAQKINGLVVPVEDEAGKPLTSGYVYLYERGYPGYYNTNGVEDQDIYYTSEVFFGKLDEQGEVFIPGAYLLPSREYELVVNGISKSNQRIYYHQSFVGRNIQAIDFSANKLTKTTFVSDHFTQSTYITMNVLSEKGNNLFPYPIDRNNESGNTFVAYLYSNQRLSVDAVTRNFSNTETFSYLKKAFVLEGQGEYEVNLDEDLVRISAPDHFDNAYFGISIAWGNNNIYGYELKEALVSKDTNIRVNLSVQDDVYQYQFRRSIDRVQHDMVLNIGETFTGSYNGLHYSYDSLGSKYYQLETKYTDEFMNEFIDFYTRYSPVAAAKSLPKDGIVFRSFVAGKEQPVTMRAYPTSSGVRYEEMESPSETVIAQSGSSISMPYIQYELINSKGEIAELSTNSVRSVPLMNAEPGAYRLMLASQNLADRFNLSMDIEFEVYSFPDEENPPQQEAIIINTGTPTGYEQVSMSVELWQLIEQGYRNNISIGWYGNRIQVNEMIDSDKTYVFHILKWLRKRNTQEYVSYYDQVTMLGSELLEKKMIPARDKSVVVQIDRPDDATINYFSSIRLNVPVIGANERYILNPYWDETFLLSPGKYSVTWSGVYEKVGYYYSKQVDLDDTAQEVRLGYADIKDQAVPIQLINEGKEVTFNNFLVVDKELGIVSQYHGSSLGLTKLMVSPGKELGFRFYITRHFDKESPWEYVWGTIPENISGSRTFDMSGDFNVALDNFVQYELGMENSYLTFVPTVKKGDLHLSNSYVMQPNGYVIKSASAGFEERDYNNAYGYYYKPIRASVTVTNSQGQVAYKQDQIYLSELNSIYTLLPDDNYKLSLSIPNGYDEVLYAEKAFSVPLTTTPSKPEVQLSQTNEGLRIEWAAGPGNVYYEVHVAEKGQEFKRVADQLRASHYNLADIAGGKTYQVKVVGVSRTGEKAVSDVKEYSVPVFTATKLDVDLASASGSMGLLKIDGELSISLEGSHRESDQGVAVVHYTMNGAKTTQVPLVFDNKLNRYIGQFKVTEGMSQVVKVEGYIVDQAGLKTAVLAKELKYKVGATVTGLVKQSGKALAGAEVMIGTPAGSARTAATEDGTYKLEGLPSGNASIYVFYQNEAYNHLIKGLILENGKHKQADIQVPVYNRLKIQFVEQETDQIVNEPLRISFSGSEEGNKNINKNGTINEQGFFRTHSGETELSKIPSGKYVIKITGSGIYKDVVETVTVHEEPDYILNPIQIEAAKLTKQTKDITLKLMFPEEEYKNITKVDYYSLYSPSVTSAFGYEVGSKYGSNKPFVSVSEKTYLRLPGVTEGVYVRYGEISVQDIVYSNDYSLYLSMDGYRTAVPAYPLIIDSETKSIDIEVDPGVKISGKLVSNGKVIAGANVYAYGGGNNYVSTTSGTDGFVLRGLASGGQVTLQINAQGYLPHTRTIALNETLDLGDIELESALFIEGRVFAEDGTTPVSGVQVSATRDSGSYYGWARTDKDGYFKVRGLIEGSYQVTASLYGYPTVSKTVEVSEEAAPVVLVMQSVKKEGHFVGEGNTLSTSVSTVTPNKNVQYRLNYKNNSNEAQSNVKITVNLPAHVNLLEKSLLLNGTPVQGTVKDGKLIVTIQEVGAGKAGVFSFDATVRSTADGVLIASAEVGDSAVMTATTNVLFVSLNAPEQTAAKAIRVYGSAKPGAKVEVFAGNLKLAEAKAEGRWWYAEVTLPIGEGMESAEFELVAVVTEEGLKYTSEPVQVKYNLDIPQVTDVKVEAGWNGEVTLNPYTNVTSFAITETTQLPAKITFSKAVDEASLNFLGMTYRLTKSEDGLTFTGMIPYGWRSYGEQLLTMTYKVGDHTITLPLMEIIVLIDPSGYVFEGSMDNRLEGVTAVVEEKTAEGVWTEWNAAFFGQVNPQTTDTEGRYGWDVIQGDWRVQFSKQGYEDYTSRIVKVPPAETMLNVPMVRTSAPAVQSVNPADNAAKVLANSTVKVVFDRPMNEINIDSEIRVVLVEDGKETPVAGTWTKQGMNGYKQDTSKGSLDLFDSNNETGWFVPDETKKLSKEVVFTPAALLKKGATYRVLIGAGLVDYDGKPLKSAVTSTFTTEAEQATTPGTGNGNPGGPGGISFVPAVTEQDEKEVTVNKSDLNKLVKDAVVEITLNGDENTVAFDREALQEAATQGYGVKITHSGAEVRMTADAFALEAGETLKVRIQGLQASLPQGYTAAGQPMQIQFVKVKNGEEQAVTAVKPVDVKLTREITLDSSLIGLYEKVNGQLIYKGRKLTASVQGSAQLSLLVYELPLIDLNGHWAEEDVKVLVSHHIINGVSETSFAPNDSLTRAQAAKLFAELLQLDINAHTSSFKDVAADAWYAGYVASAEQAGIFQGEGGSFRPDDTITRQELAVVISRLLSASEGEVLSTTFADNENIAEWAQNGVAAAVKHGIILGNEHNEFRPEALASRAEAAVMIRRLMKTLD